MPRKTKNEAETTNPIEAPVATEPASEPTAPEPEPSAESPKPKGKRKKLALSGTATLADISASYLEHMENKGNSTGTIASYGMELKTAMAELGEATPIAEITPEKVQAFFKSKRVMKLRSGKNKSQLSIDKTRRVLRLALVWAAERGIIAKAPIPEPAEAK